MRERECVFILKGWTTLLPSCIKVSRAPNNSQQQQQQQAQAEQMYKYCLLFGGGLVRLSVYSFYQSTLHRHFLSLSTNRRCLQEKHWVSHPFPISLCSKEIVEGFWANGALNAKHESSKSVKGRGTGACSLFAPSRVSSYVIKGVRRLLCPPGGHQLSCCCCQCLRHEGGGVWGSCIVIIHQNRFEASTLFF